MTATRAAVTEHIRTSYTCFLNIYRRAPFYFTTDLPVSLIPLTSLLYTDLVIRSDTKTHV